MRTTRAMKLRSNVQKIAARVSRPEARRRRLIIRRATAWPASPLGKAIVLDCIRRQSRNQEDVNRWLTQPGSKMVVCVDHATDGDGEDIVAPDVDVDSALGVSAAEFRDWYNGTEKGQSDSNIFQVMDVLNPNVRDEANDDAHRLFFAT